MKRLAHLIASIALSSASTLANAQVYPMPSEENPRLQDIAWHAGEEVVLTALPESGLLVVLEPGEGIARVVLSDSTSWDVSVSSEYDTFFVTPKEGARDANMTIETGYRSYQFRLRTGTSLSAAAMVRFSYDFAPAAEPETVDEPESTERWSYRMRGDRVVRPALLYDDGRKTYIEYGPEQPLPAVFAIGASGDEEVVDGHMRGGRFVIDRVHQELVFRIDKEKATARRNREPDEPS